ncbi:MAG: hypothetical protein HQL72_01330 [Magnetococcales bacterium]|nr:hypothetical protein [Magnetococcales bacterium]
MSPGHIDSLGSSSTETVFWRSFSAVSAFFLLLFFSPAWAVGGGVDPLIGELDKLMVRAKQSALASDSFLQEMEAILKKYRPSHRQILFSDDFSDGNYTHNPTWTVLRGRFSIDGYGALFSTSGSFDDTLLMQQGGVVPEQSSERKQAGQLLALMQSLSGEGKKQPTKKNIKRATIHTPVATPNHFDLSLTFRSGQDRGVGEVGLFVDNPQKSGYRLLLSAEPTANQSISLVRYENGHSRVLRGIGGVYLGDGLTHRVRWRRLESGLMSVWIDGIEMVRIRDSALWDGFSGLVIVNDQGEFAFDQIVLKTAE